MPQPARSVQLVADRAAFWAELGAVSAPVLLGRLGRHLERFAAGDPEAAAALQLAARHMHRNCLVWRAESESERPEQPRRSPPPGGSGLHRRGAADGAADGRGDAVVGWLSAQQAEVPRERDWSCAPAESHDDASEGSGDASEENADASEGSAAVPPRKLAAAAKGFAADAGPWPAEADGQPSESDSESVSMPPDGLRAFDLLLPWYCRGPAKLMPVVGSLAAQIVWLVAIAISIPVIWANAWIWGDPFGGHLSHLVGPMVDVTLGLKFVVTIPLVITARRVVVDSTFDAALRSELGSPNGPGFVRFFQRTVGIISSILFLVTLLECIRDGLGSDWYSKFVIMRLAVSLSFLSVFSALYKLSVSRVEELRTLVAEPKMSARFWRHATREYLATTRTIDRLWRLSGFSTAVTVFLISNLLFAATFFAIAIADFSINLSVSAWRPWLWTMKLGATSILLLYLISNINSRCSSNRHATRSVVQIARHHLCRSQPRCLLEHLAFIHCVDGVPCGVEVAILLPVLTSSFFAPVIRVAFIVAPFVAGWAYSIAHIKHSHA